MPYKLFNRKTIRLVGYDYRREGWYFVTICTKDREHYFGEVVAGKMQYSDMGQIAYDYWLDIPDHWPFVELHEFVVMPNHVHGLLKIKSNPVGSLESNDPTGLDFRVGDDPKNKFMANISPKKNSLSRIIGTYKAACTHMIRQVTDDPFHWQRRFHDRIVRNQQEFDRIAQYIRNNPRKWNEDCFYP